MMNVCVQILIVSGTLAVSAHTVIQDGPLVDQSWSWNRGENPQSPSKYISVPSDTKSLNMRSPARRRSDGPSGPGGELGGATAHRLQKPLRRSSIWTMFAPISDMFTRQTTTMSPLKEMMHKLSNVPSLRLPNNQFRSRMDYYSRKTHSAPQSTYTTRGPHRFGPPKGEDIVDSTTQMATPEETTEEVVTQPDDKNSHFYYASTIPPTTTTEVATTTTQKPTTTTKKPSQKDKYHKYTDSTKFPLNAYFKIKQKYLKARHPPYRRPRIHNHKNHHHGYHHPKETATTKNIWPNIVTKAPATTTTTAPAKETTTASYGTRPRHLQGGHSTPQFTFNEGKYFTDHKNPTNSVYQSFPNKMITNAKKMFGRLMSPLTGYARPTPKHRLAHSAPTRYRRPHRHVLASGPLNRPFAPISHQASPNFNAPSATSSYAFPEPVVRPDSEQLRDRTDHSTNSYVETQYDHRDRPTVEPLQSASHQRLNHILKRPPPSVSEPLRKPMVGRLQRTRFATQAGFAPEINPVGTATLHPQQTRRTRAHHVHN